MKRVLAAIALCLLFADSIVLGAEAISLHGFRDGIRHWKNGQDQDGYATYRPEQVRQIADNLLLYQHDNGGWPANFDPTRILSEAERRELAKEKCDERATTFDNRSTYTEVEYLAAAFQQTGDPRYRDAAVRGIEFVLAAQYDNGGWPHSYPRRDNYRPRVTIVDDVMSGVLRTLRHIDSGEPPYGFVEPELRSRVHEALARGDRCLLRLQVVVNGRRTGWAGQYDEVTLEPTKGRSYELPSLISAESVGVLRYLMSIDQPSDEVREAVQAGAEWLERSRIEGLRIERVDIEPIRYDNHTARHDVLAVSDPEAPPLWARFYEIDTNRPFMANRDGGKVYQLSEVEHERRTGYSWYGNYARDFLKRDYPAWQAKWGGR